MSRPFSYNDDNFTVIGNILFVHFKVNNYIDQYSSFLEIPEELYKHMVNKSNLFIFSGTQDESSKNTADVRVGVTKSNIDKKYYFFAGDIINPDFGDYLIGYYILKDI